jgi:hypothetical protein
MSTIISGLVSGELVGEEEGTAIMFSLGRPRGSEALGIEPFVHEVLNEIKAITLFGKPMLSDRRK